MLTRKTNKKQPKKYQIRVMDFTSIKGFKFGFGFILGASTALFIWDFISMIISSFLNMPKGMPL